MSESLIERLRKLRDARLAAKEAPDEEVTLLDMAMDYIGELENNQVSTKVEKLELVVPPPSERPKGHPLTLEGVLAWAEEESARQNVGKEGTDGVSVEQVLAVPLAEFWTSDYSDWSKQDLLDLVVAWDMEGVRGWKNMPAEELAQCVLDEANEVNKTGGEIVDVEGAVDYLENQ